MSSLTPELAAFYNTTKLTMLDHALTTTEQETFTKQAAQLNQHFENPLAAKLATAYQRLITANLSSADHQTFYLLACHLDHTTSLHPISAQQVQDWRRDQSAELGLITENAFLLNQLSVDETAILALL